MSYDQCTHQVTAGKICGEMVLGFGTLCPVHGPAPDHPHEIVENTSLEKPRPFFISPEQQRRQMFDRMTMTRRGRRILGTPLPTVRSDQACRGCGGPVGIVAIGQIKNYCSKACKKASRDKRNRPRA